MKVGVDARSLSRPLTGIGRYTLEMCRALSKINDISLYLYSPAPVFNEYRLGLESAHIRNKDWHGDLSRQFWSETYLPLWVKEDDVDLFWGPAHRLPRLLINKISSVVTIHDLVWKYAGETMRPISRLLEHYQMPLAVRAADAVVADSQATADAVAGEFCIAADRLSVVLLGTNATPCVAPLETLQPLGVNRPYFLFVGTLEPRKNLARLLAAYSRLPEPTKAQCMLVIAGGKGWGGVNIDDMVADLSLLSHVRVLGYIDESVLAALYANAEFLAMPSLYEGFGLPLIEAMAHGVPALTANNSSMPEVAGDAALLVNALDVEAIENGLNQLIINEKLKSELAGNAKRNASRFDWDESAKQLVGVFEKAISIRESRLA